MTYVWFMFLEYSTGVWQDRKEGDWEIIYGIDWTKSERAVNWLIGLLLFTYMVYRCQISQLDTNLSSG